MCSPLDMVIGHKHNRMVWVWALWHQQSYTSFSHIYKTASYVTLTYVLNTLRLILSLGDKRRQNSTESQPETIMRVFM